MKLPNTISKDMESPRWILSMFSRCVMCNSFAGANSGLFLCLVIMNETHMSLLMRNIFPVLIGSVPFYNSVPLIDKVVGLTFSLVVYGIFTDLTNVENMWVYEIMLDHVIIVES